MISFSSFADVLPIRLYEIFLECQLCCFEPDCEGQNVQRQGEWCVGRAWQREGNLQPFPPSGGVSECSGPLWTLKGTWREKSTQRDLGNVDHGENLTEGQGLGPSGSITESPRSGSRGPGRGSVLSENAVLGLGGRTGGLDGGCPTNDSAALDGGVCVVSDGPLLCVSGSSSIKRGWSWILQLVTS